VAPKRNRDPTNTCSALAAPSPSESPPRSSPAIICSAVAAPPPPPLGDGILPRRGLRAASEPPEPQVHPRRRGLGGGVPAPARPRPIPGGGVAGGALGVEPGPRLPPPPELYIHDMMPDYIIDFIVLL